MYYRGCSACVFIFDLTNRKSLSDLNSWVDEFLEKMQKEFCAGSGQNHDDSMERLFDKMQFIVLGNKCEET